MATHLDPSLDDGRQIPARLRSARRWSARDLALVAAFAAFTAVLAIAPPVYPLGNDVPIVLQNLGVMLAGALLGWKRGGAAILLMIAVGFLGVPMLSGGRNMYAALGGVTLGFVIGYPLAAAATGALVQARLPMVRWWWVFIAAVVGGIVVDYLCGVPYRAWRANLTLAQSWALNAVYLPGDLIKAAVVAAIAPAVHRAVPGLAEPLRRRRAASDRA